MTQIGQETSRVSMHTICTIIKKLNMQGRNFDEQNPEIFLCDQRLENIFGMKALHVSQVQTALAKSLNPLNNVNIESTIQSTKSEKLNKRYKLSAHVCELFIATADS